MCLEVPQGQHLSALAPQAPLGTVFRLTAAPPRRAVKRLRLAVTHDLQGDRRAGLGAGHGVAQIVAVGRRSGPALRGSRRRSADRPARRGSRLDVADQRAAYLGKVQARRDVGGDRLHGDAELRTPHATVCDQLVHDRPRHVRRDRKSQTDASTRRRHDLRVDPDQLPLQIDQRAAGVALIDRRVRLDEVLVASRSPDPVVRPFALMMPDVTVCPRPSGLPTARTTSPTRELIGIGQRQRPQSLRVDLDHREIARRIVANDGRRQHALVGRARRECGPRDSPHGGWSGCSRRRG